MYKFSNHKYLLQREPTSTKLVFLHHLIVYLRHRALGMHWWPQSPKFTPIWQQYAAVFHIWLSLIFCLQLEEVIRFALNVTETGSAANIAWCDLNSRIRKARKANLEVLGLPSHRDKRQLVRFWMYTLYATNNIKDKSSRPAAETPCSQILHRKPAWPQRTQ